MHGGGRAREGRGARHYTWPKAVNRGQAGPNLIYITLYGRRWQDLGWDLYAEVWDGIYIRRLKLRIRSAGVKLSGGEGSRMIILALLIGWMCVGFSAFDAAAQAYGPIFR